MVAEQLNQARQQFDRDGFAVVRDFVGRDEIDQINEEVDRYATEVVPTLPAGSAFYEIKDDPKTLKQLPRINEHDDYFQYWYGYQRDLTQELIREGKL